MLAELQIVNFAIIEKQSIRFEPGLNVISGETGAGKSIILDALKLILGGRGGVDFIRSGAESLEISAVFNLESTGADVKSSLPEMLVEDGNSELVITREISLSGKNKVYINGRAGTVSLLTEISSSLINICGQNQSLKLFDPNYHLTLIDIYGGHESTLKDYQTAYLRWFEIHSKIEGIRNKAHDTVMRKQGLEAVAEELGGLGLRPNIHAELDSEVKKLSFGEQLISGCGAISQIFEQDEGLSDILQELNNTIQSLAKLDPGITKFKEIFDSGKANLEEFEREISSYVQGVSLDEERLGEVQDKLSSLIRLERKYKTDDAGLLRLLENVKVELLSFGNEEDLDKYISEEESLRQVVLERGSDLRSARERAVKRMIKEVESDLASLNMKDTKIRAAIDKIEISERGLEKIELLISTNKGEKFGSIKDMASGGELSRIMLVLKKVLRDRSGVHVLVFDEVDTGISGGVARAVGEKLKSLASQSQVICITHLAQVASLADHHLLVQKLVGTRTKTKISSLSLDQRVEEIARMLAGYDVTAASRASAKELLSSHTSAN